jgi:hypothetical protein
VVAGALIFRKQNAGHFTKDNKQFGFALVEGYGVAAVACCDVTDPGL